MSVNKKIVFLPYDFDTSIGINNEGALQFSYNLEDTDKIGNNTDVYNGQESVLWNNVRSAFFDDLKSMYQTLRSDGELSYEKIEQMFEEHQSKWPEAVFNEDSWFTYLQPLVENGDASYLSMLQGSKAEQRKWWLYNRFRYIDSKYNAGDALTDVITLRGYAKSNITVTPYADIYATVKYGSYLVQQRASRNIEYTLVCPLDNVNDTEIYIYSASQLASVGDLSGLMVGYANFSNATRLQDLKLGDSSQSFENDNMLDLYLGNNVLLETIDVRNCVNLGGSRNVGGNTIISTTPTVDLSGCVELKNVYFDNTSVKGVTVPNGAVIETLHLPGTITNLTLRNLKALADLTVPTYENVTTLWVENCSNEIEPLEILSEIPANSRVRIIGFEMTVSTVSEIDDFYDSLDVMRGLDENGNTIEIADGGAQVSGTIHVPSMSGEKYSELTARYPYITLDVGSTESVRRYYTYDGQTLVGTVNCLNGVPQSAAPSVPSRSSSAQYTYTAIGWSSNQDSQTADYNHNAVTMGDANYYAAYSRTVRSYTVTWVNNGTTVKTETKEYGSTASWTGAMPTDGDGNSATGWEPTPGIITGNTTYTASYDPLTGAYGVEWDYSNSSPVLTRRGLAASFTNPVPATSVSGTGSSPFDNIMPWAGMKKYNIIDNVIAYSQDDPEFSETDYDVVVYIPQFYYKAEKNTTTQKWTWAISPTAKNGYELHPGSGRYIGKYLISGDTSSAIYSKAGAVPLTDKTLAQYNSGASLKGQDWKAIDIQTWSAIQLLYLVEFANFNSQAMLVDMSQSATLVNTGTTANAVYHTIKGGRTNNQYRWIENLFSQLWTLVDKYNISTAGQIAIYIGSSGAYTGHFIPNTSQASKYITDFGYSNSCKWVFAPSEVTDDSDNDKFVCDTVTTVYNNGTKYPIVGGHYGVEYKNGIFYLHFINDSNRHSQYIGSRLIFTGN